MCEIYKSYQNVNFQQKHLIQFITIFFILFNFSFAKADESKILINGVISTTAASSIKTGCSKNIEPDRDKQVYLKRIYDLDYLNQDWRMKNIKETRENVVHVTNTAAGALIIFIFIAVYCIFCSVINQNIRDDLNSANFLIVRSKYITLRISGQFILVALILISAYILFILLNKIYLTAPPQALDIDMNSTITR